MADRWAVATGNWSATGTWNGGTLPGSGDDVFADGFTVTIDQNVTVNAIRNGARSGGTDGGKFIIANGVTINAASVTGGTNGATGACLQFGATTCTLNITLMGGPFVSGSQPSLDITAGTVTFTGNISGQYNGTVTVFVRNTATLNVTGTVTGGGNWTCIAITLVDASTLTLTGNTTSNGSHDSCFGIRSSTSGTVTINGSALGATPAGGYQTNAGMLVDGASTVVINGDVIAGWSPGVICSSAATITVTGTVSPGTVMPGISSTGNATIILSTAALTASAGAAAVVSSGAASIVRIAGDLIDHAPTGQQALVARRVVANFMAPHYWRLKFYSGGTVDLVTTDMVAGLPAAANVRSGTTYGATSELTGTMIVPPSSLVLAGVPVDATVGTLIADAAGIWSYPAISAVTAGSMGERLKDAATVATTGAQIATMGS